MQYVTGSAALPWSGSIAVPSPFDAVTAASVNHGFRSLADRTAHLYNSIGSSADFAGVVTALSTSVEADLLALSTSVAADIATEASARDAADDDITDRFQAVFADMFMSSSLGFSYTFTANSLNRLTSSLWSGFVNNSKYVSTNVSGAISLYGCMTMNKPERVTAFLDKLGEREGYIDDQRADWVVIDGVWTHDQIDAAINAAASVDGA